MASGKKFVINTFLFLRFGGHNDFNFLMPLGNCKIFKKIRKNDRR